MSAHQDQTIPNEFRDALRTALQHHRDGELEDAVAIYRDVVQHLPDNATVLLSLGAALLGLEKPGEAIDVLEAARAVRPDHPDTCFSLAEAYRAAGRIEDAYEAGKAGLAGNPDYLQGRTAIADALLDMGRHDEARQAFMDILQRAPGDMAARAKLGSFHFHAGEFGRAESELTAALKALPDDVEANWHLGSLYLGQRRWSEGWPLYRWRWPMAKRPAPESLVDLPTWDGAGLEGKSLMVWSEQGLGDELMFSTCLPDLLERVRPEACYWSCDHRLAEFFGRSFPQLHILPIDKQSDDGGLARVPKCDFQVSAGDLPRYLRRYTADFPKAAPVFTPDAGKTEMWRARLAELGDGMKVGIAWRGGVLERFKRAKSSELGDWGEILAVPGVQFINLQHGDCGDELAATETELGCRIHDWTDMDPIADPDGQMALIANLDLVVQTSNASAHMAGVLGVPAWVMLPFVADWRWSFDGEDCVWYPSMRLFRQRAPGDWKPVFAEVADALRRQAAP